MHYLLLILFHYFDYLYMTGIFSGLSASVSRGVETIKEDFLGVARVLAQIGDGIRMFMMISKKETKMIILMTKQDN